MKSGKRSNLVSRKANYGWIFVAPFLIGFFMIYAKIFIQSIVFSFSEVTTDSAEFVRWIGFDYYKEVLVVNQDFNKELISSIASSLLNVPVVLIFSLFVAVLLSQKLRCRGLFRAIFFLPVILATGIIASAELNNAIVGSMWGAAAVETSASGASLSAMDIQQYLLDLNISTEFVEYIITAVNNIYNILNISGVQILIFLAGLQSISPAIYESADIEGATKWEVFWKITFPMISPLILLNMVYSIIDSFTNSQNKLIMLIENAGKTYGKIRIGISSAMAWTYSSVTIILVVAAMLLVSRFVFYSQKR